MSKAMSKVIMTAAAAGLALAPISAQANTRAGDQAPVYTSTSAAQPGIGRGAEGESIEGVPGLVIGILAAAAIIGAVVVIASEDSEDNNDNQSPGT
jgi:hypothetical protein